MPVSPDDLLSAASAPAGVTADDLLSASEPEGSTTTTPTTTGNIMETAAAAPRRWLGPPLAAAGRLARQGGTQPVEGPGILSDLGTVAQTALLPEATAVGMTLEGAGRLAGMQPENAKTLGDVGYGVTAAGQAIKGGIEGVQAWRARRAAAAIEGGTVVQREIPKAAKGVSETIQNRLFDPVLTYAKENGIGIPAGTDQATKLADDIESGVQEWGGSLPSQVKALVTKLRDPEAGLVGYEDMDNALKPLQKIRTASTARATINDAMTEMVKGTPVEGKLNAARLTWGKVAVPIRRLATKVKNAASPQKAVQILVSGPDAPYHAKIAEDVLGGDSANWQRVLSGMREARRNAKTLQGLGQYFQHRALYHGLGAVAGGGLGSKEGYPWEGALVGLAVGGALPYAGHAARFLASGMSGRPVAAALARTISAWSQSQDPETQAAAGDVAAALQGQP